ncbi:MAG: hypothetical protein K6U89_03130, partial [Chloroflexi bacterium]|nr:hypothetical protein [Chloroflexota bacterium]
GLLAARGALEAAAAPLRGSNPAPAVRPVRAGPQIAQPREGPRRDADNAPVATATAIPSPSPAPTATAADPARPRLEVRVANPRPDPFGEQTVYVRLLLGDTPIRGADCRVDLAYRTVTHTYERRTLADGEFELDFPLQGATPGYTVQVTVECQTTTGVISGTTQFTPGG